MKQLAIISLLTLLLFPIAWNGLSFLHFVVEHTHTFCYGESEHTHPDAGDCLSVLQFADNNDQGQLPTSQKTEFQELQQFLTTNFHFQLDFHLSPPEINFLNHSFLDDDYFSDVFHPPVLR